MSGTHPGRGLAPQTFTSRASTGASKKMNQSRPPTAAISKKRKVVRGWALLCADTRDCQPHPPTVCRATARHTQDAYARHTPGTNTHTLTLGVTLTDTHTFTRTLTHTLTQKHSALLCTHTSDCQPHTHTRCGIQGGICSPSVEKGGPAFQEGLTEIAVRGGDFSGGVPSPEASARWSDGRWRRRGGMVSSVGDIPGI